MFERFNLFHHNKISKTNIVICIFFKDQDKILLLKKNEFQSQDFSNIFVEGIFDWCGINAAGLTSSFMLFSHVNLTIVNDYIDHLTFEQNLIM